MKLLSAFYIAVQYSTVLAASSALQKNSPVSITIGLKHLFNNKGISSHPGGADFDGQGGGYPLNQVPSKILPYRGINFTLPDWSSPSSDNVLSQGQTISVAAGRFQSLHLLGAADGGSIYTNNISVSYADGTTATQAILVPGWKANRGLVNTAFTFTSTGVDGNSSHMHYFQVPLNATKNLTSIILPIGTVGSSRFHVFAISLFTASSLLHPSSRLADVSASGPAITFQHIRSRNQWYNDSALAISDVESTALSFMKVIDRPSTQNAIIQVMEVTINNLPLVFASSTWLTGEHTLEINSPSLKTVYAGRLNRLRAGDQARVKVGVINDNGAVRGSTAMASAVLKDSKGNIIAQSGEFTVTAGIPEYNSTLESLATHEAPKWFEDSKFGIFVHWGVYSVPAFAPSGVQYAEWYWWQLHNPNNTNSPTWVYHKETYGEEFLYDDFIPQFNPTAANWSADTFTDLFADSGAKYFVLVTKHHDGISLFNAGNTTNRSTVSLGPKRDFIGEILTSASTRHPDLVGGTYFSTPEWFNPAWAPYGFTSWPGGLAHNAYNWSQLEPYTGYIPVNDFIQDIQKPQMEILMDKYGTNVMWCDIGGWSNITEIVPGWYNRKYGEGKNVAIDDRCATWAYDFATPEYTTYGVVKQDKWESNSGLDPFSYGFNAQTPDANYMNTTTAIHMLTDIVSKNGNWLLDIGPMANGTVVTPEVKTLQGLGSWLKIAGKSIYATDYWFITPQESSNIRFTTTPLAFYITSTSNPSPSFRIVSPVPILTSDKITLLGGSGKALKFSIDSSGALTINVPESEASTVSDAWVFEVVY